MTAISSKARRRDGDNGNTLVQPKGKLSKVRAVMRASQDMTLKTRGSLGCKNPYGTSRHTDSLVFFLTCLSQVLESRWGWTELHPAEGKAGRQCETTIQQVPAFCGHDRQVHAMPGSTVGLGRSQISALMPGKRQNRKRSCRARFEGRARMCTARGVK